MNQEMIRLIDGICREKNIDRDSFFEDLENAIASAMRKAYGESEDIVVRFDRMGGEISAAIDGEPVDTQTLGRIAAQTAKQVIIQKTRERERNSIFDEFSDRRSTIVTGTVVRAEGPNLLVNIGRTEGFLPRSEQIPGEMHQVGERIRVLILDVREQGNQVKVVLSRSHPDFILRLFELEVPEVSERIIEIRALAREAGYRTKVAVSSIDSKVDAVGACVGVRGSRIKNIVDELSGEKIDIVRWNESSQILIQNALKPAEVEEIALCFELNKATVVVADDQLSLAIGKRGQNVRLAARLTKWDIDILTPVAYNTNLELLENTVKSVEGVDDMIVDKLIAIGCVSVMDLDDVGAEPLVKELELEPELADRLIETVGEEAIRIEEEKEAAAKEKSASDGNRPRRSPGLSSFVATDVPAAPESSETPEAPAEEGGEPKPAADSLVAGAFVPEAESEAGPEESAPSEEAPEVEEAPSAEETPEVEETPSAEETPEVEETPSAEDTPAEEEASPDAEVEPPAEDN